MVLFFLTSLMGIFFPAMTVQPQHMFSATQVFIAEYIALLLFFNICFDIQYRYWKKNCRRNKKRDLKQKRIQRGSMNKT